MVFNSDVFLFAFLPVVFALFWAARTKLQRYVVLTVSGYVFYGYWDWRFCFLLLFSTIVSFSAGLRISRSARPSRRRAWMVGAISVDLFLLGLFKYYNFFADTARHLTGTTALPVLHVVLPIGISFYTFHTISYVIDVWDRRVKATSNPLEYLTYVSLFSQLVAGPIVRFRQIENDLEQIDRSPSEENIARGIGFFLVGLLKKVVIADGIARHLDVALLSPNAFSTIDAWVAAFGYTFQLYFDFSGYSDMAIGLGLLFGIHIPQNFNAPYRADGIADFWRRWHISLSSWLRDYLYIRLGGNRKGTIRTYVNLMVTMLLGGLWHGANWTFVVWGAYHGGLLAAGRALSPGGRLPVLIRRGGTFLLAVVGWVFFRSTDLHMAGQWLARMFVWRGGTETSITLIARVLVAAAYAWLIPETWDMWFGLRLRWAPVYAAAGLAIYLVLNGRESVFLYYQF